ncbi:hypothetical protein QTN25_002000 [Entamoeba marina]
MTVTFIWETLQPKQKSKKDSFIIVDNSVIPPQLLSQFDSSNTLKTTPITPKTSPKKRKVGPLKQFRSNSHSDLSAFVSPLIDNKNNEPQVLTPGRPNFRRCSLFQNSTHPVNSDQLDKNMVLTGNFSLESTPMLQKSHGSPFLFKKKPKERKQEPQHNPNYFERQQLKKNAAFHSKEICNFDELSSRCLNTKICCNDNIMILIKTTESKLYACFQQDFIPNSLKYQSLKTQSTEFDVFGFNDVFWHPSYKSNPSDTNSLILYPNNEQTFVLTCFSAFWIMNDGKFYLHQSVKSVYNTTGNNSPRQSISHHSRVEVMYAIKWR